MAEPSAGRQQGVPFEELLERFRAKMAMIPEECHEAMGWLYVYRQIQEQRMRLDNRMRQLAASEKRVFWARVLPPEMVAPMAAVAQAPVEALEKAERKAAAEIQRSLGRTDWYRQVAVQAARGVGISEKNGGLSAAKILWAFGSASRFPTFGRIVRYARLAPEDGQAPRRKPGQRIRYNPQAWQALFDLSEVWARMPDCYWRVRWDAWKAYYQERHPDYPKWRIHAMGRRKVLREFLKDLYEIWREWEFGRGAEPSLPPVTVVRSA